MIYLDYQKSKTINKKGLKFQKIFILDYQPFILVLILDYGIAI